MVGRCACEFLIVAMVHGHLNLVSSCSGNVRKQGNIQKHATVIDPSQLHWSKLGMGDCHIHQEGIILTLWFRNEWMGQLNAGADGSQ